MDNISQRVSFFLETYTPQGLCSFFKDLYSDDVTKSIYQITGGIASVCSMLMKLVADNVVEQGFSVLQISNPLSSHYLDAVYFPQLNTALSNGGENNIMSGRYPVVVEKVVGLSPCFDRGIISENAHNIKQMFDEEKREKLRAIGFLSAAYSLMNDGRMIEQKYMDVDKIYRYASRLARREFGSKLSKNGREYRCFLSSITSRGVEIYSNTLLNLCDRFYVFNDRYGVVAECIVGFIKEYALSYGYDVIACYCPMSSGGSVEHLIVPELELCFFSDKAYHSADFVDCRKVSSNRFVDIKALSENKKRLSFDRKGADEMLGEAVKLFSSTENIRKRLDLIYFSCLDKSALSAAADRITDEILNRKP